MLNSSPRWGRAWPIVGQIEPELASPPRARRHATRAAVRGLTAKPTKPDDIDRLKVELERIRAERDRLFRVAVSDDQLDQYGVPRECSQAESISRVLEWMTTFDLPDGKVSAALAEHDRRSEK